MNTASEDFQRQAFELMFQARQIGEDEATTRLADATREGYWRDLCPGMSIGGDVGRGGDVAPDPQAAAGYAEHGFCHLPHAVAPEIPIALAEAVRTVRGAGWPVVFSLVYDGFWELALTAVRKAVEGVAGRSLLMLPDVAVHYVDTTPGTTGWAPHPDGAGKSGRHSSWVPLTEATLDNGCMYAIALNDDTREAVDSYVMGEVAGKQHAAVLLQNSRALPASPGSVLAWNFDVIHWGSVSRGAKEPRISVAFEWIQDDITPSDDESPLIRPDDGLPSFAFRLKAIRSSISSYWRFDDRLLPFVKLAEQL